MQWNLPMEVSMKLTVSSLLRSRRVLLPLAGALAVLLVTTSGFAGSFTIDVSSNEVGALPWVITAFANSSSPSADVYPVGAKDYYYFSLYDNGATHVYMSPGTASGIGLVNGASYHLRINGFSQIQDGTLFAPIYSGYQAGVTGDVRTDPKLDDGLILLGSPVTNATSAVIDYTTTITKGPYAVLGGAFATAPDITLYNGSAANPFVDSVTVGLDRFGAPERYLMSGVTLYGAAGNASSGAWGSSSEFLYDTGTTVTMVNQSIASAILGGSVIPIGSSDPLLPNYTLSSIRMAGLDGTSFATFQNVPIVVLSDTDLRWGGRDVIIGSNLFSDTSILFDGVSNKLIIEAPSIPIPTVPEPSTWVLLASGLFGVTCLVRRRTKD
jgi:hypothetical protein